MSTYGGTGRLGAGVAACLQAAAAAPSIHNSQPWRFRIHESGLEIVADPTRVLAIIDPDGRGAAISVGAAVFNLRVAVLARGWTPMLTLDDAPSIEFGPAVAPDATVRALASAITRRRSTRSPFARTVVPVAVVDELRAAAAIECTTLTPLDAIRRDAVLALTRTADERHRANGRYRRELALWTVPERGRRDGVPSEAFGPVDAAHRMPVRDFGLVRPERLRRAAVFEPHPQLVVLYTRGDGPSEWLRAGQALQRVLLTATVRGVSTHPMTQALEFPDLRRALAVPSAGLVAQMVLRIGYGQPAAPSPRRLLADLVSDSDEVGPWTRAPERPPWKVEG